MMNVIIFTYIRNNLYKNYLPTKTDVELCFGPYGHIACPALFFSNTYLVPVVL